jgi:hypothetical protein
MQPDDPTEAARRREGRVRKIGRMNRVSQETGSLRDLTTLRGGA